MTVRVSGSKVSYPAVCCCCTGPADAWLGVRASHQQKRVTWEFPLCQACRAHVDADEKATLDQAHGASSGAVARFFLSSLVGAACAGLLLLLWSMGLPPALPMTVRQVDLPLVAGPLALVGLLVSNRVLAARARKQAERRKAAVQARVQGLRRPGCSTVGPAVWCTWDGRDEMVFGFASSAFEAAFLDLNRAIVVRER